MNKEVKRLAVDAETRDMLNVLKDKTGKLQKRIVYELVKELYDKTMKDK